MARHIPKTLTQCETALLEAVYGLADGEEVFYAMIGQYAQDFGGHYWKLATRTLRYYGSKADDTDHSRRYVLVRESNLKAVTVAIKTGTYDEDAT